MACMTVNRATKDAIPNTTSDGVLRILIASKAMQNRNTKARNEYIVSAIVNGVLMSLLVGRGC